jgi:hypothetical protein
MNRSFGAQEPRIGHSGHILRIGSCVRNRREARTCSRQQISRATYRETRNTNTPWAGQKTRGSSVQMDTWRTTSSIDPKLSRVLAQLAFSSPNRIHRLRRVQWFIQFGRQARSDNQSGSCHRKRLRPHHTPVAPAHTEVYFLKAVPHGSYGSAARHEKTTKKPKQS